MSLPGNLRRAAEIAETLTNETNAGERVQLAWIARDLALGAAEDLARIAGDSLRAAQAREPCPRDKKCTRGDRKGGT